MKERPMAIVPDKYRGTQIYSLVYCRLLEAARNKEGVSYEDLGEMMGLEPGDSRDQEIAQLLGEINEDEHNNGRPMLSAVAVDSTKKMPGEGFFNYAKKLGKFDGDTEEDKRDFWREEIQEVFEIW
jgi:hypothetical protein